MTRNVALAQENGLVTSRRHESDARIRPVTITEQGGERLPLPSPIGALCSRALSMRLAVMLQTGSGGLWQDYGQTVSQGACRSFESAEMISRAASGIAFKSRADAIDVETFRGAKCAIRGSKISIWWRDRKLHGVDETGMLDVATSRCRRSRKANVIRAVMN